MPQRILRATIRAVARFVIGMTNKAYWVILAYIVSRVIAVFVFSHIEDWRPIDAYWWGEVASLTIGYGDLSPNTDLGRMLAGPFHFFWVYYCGLAIAGHLVKWLFRDRNVMTHGEQEWLFHVVTIVFNWVRWMVMVLAAMAKKLGVEVPPMPHALPDGTPMVCPDQAADTTDGDLHEERASTTQNI